jgi:hypothetical protein
MFARASRSTEKGHKISPKENMKKGNILGWLTRFSVIW